MTSKQWFNLHAWAGLFVGALLLVTCFSGTLATLSHEIEYLSDTKFRAISNLEQTDFAAIEQTLDEHYSGAQVLYVMRHKQDYLATEVSLKVGDEFRFIYVDGGTGELLGEGPWARVSRFLRNWHMNLSMSWVGKLIVTSLSLLLIITLVSTFYVYRNWWQQFFRRPKSLSMQSRSAWADWHKLLGLWGYWFVVVMAITGLWYLVEHGLQTAKVDHYVAPPATLKSLAQEPKSSDAEPISMAAAVASAKEAFPSLDVRYISYPNAANKAIQVRGYNDDVLLRLRANKVYLHPTTGAVLGVQKGEELSVLPRIKDTADPLHFGNFAGLGTKLIWAFFGAVLTFLCAAGMVMSWLRIKRKQPSMRRWLGVSGMAAVGLSIASVVLTALTFYHRTAPSTWFSPILG